MGHSETREAPREILYLLLVPLEVGDQDKAVGWIRVLKDNPVSFSFLVENVVHPLEGGQRDGAHRPVLSPRDTHAGRGRLREGHPILKGHEAQGIHTQAILSQGSALGSRRDLPSPTTATQWGTPWPSPRGSLQLLPQGSTRSSLFRPVLATPVYILCCGFTGLVFIPFHCPRDSGEVSRHPDRTTGQRVCWEFLLQSELATRQGKERLVFWK